MLRNAKGNGRAAKGTVPFRKAKRAVLQSQHTLSNHYTCAMCVNIAASSGLNHQGKRSDHSLGRPAFTINFNVYSPRVIGVTWAHSIS